MDGNQDQDGFVWDDLRVFLAVAREGTISAAALRLRLGLATVSRRIERLEGAIGRPLFQRLQSGYRLTEDGAAMVERAEEVEASARALATGMAQVPGVSGVVRLATAENLATGLILPALPGLRAQHPGLALELVTDISTVNLHRRDADIALRMVKPDRGRVTLQRLGVLGYGLYGADAWLRARGLGPGDRIATDEGDFITWGEAQSRLPAAHWVETRLRGRRAVLTTSSLVTQVTACVAGLGLAVLPHFLARPQGLRCLDADLGIDQAIWLVTQSDLMHSRRIRAVADFLRGLVEENRDALAQP